MLYFHFGADAHQMVRFMVREAANPDVPNRLTLCTLY